MQAQPLHVSVSSVQHNTILELKSRDLIMYVNIRYHGQTMQNHDDGDTVDMKDWKLHMHVQEEVSCERWPLSFYNSSDS